MWTGFTAFNGGRFYGSVMGRIVLIVRLEACVNIFDYK